MSLAKKGTAMAVAIALASSTAFLAPKRSEAIVGTILVATGVAAGAGSILLQIGVATAFVGGFMIMGSVGGTIFIDNGRWVDVIEVEGNGSAKLFWAGAITGLAGILMLDEQNSAVSLQSLSGAEAEKLGLTRAEHVAFEAEREELNILLQEAQREWLEAKNAGQSQVDLTSLLKEGGGQISEEARSGASKIARAAIQRLAR